jgi:hypothetical protein
MGHHHHDGMHTYGLLSGRNDRKLSLLELSRNVTIFASRSRKRYRAGDDIDVPLEHSASGVPEGDLMGGTEHKIHIGDTRYDLSNYKVCLKPVTIPVGVSISISSFFASRRLVRRY